MRKWVCVPMITLCLLLCGCGESENTVPVSETFREKYQTMSGCTMEGEVTVGAGSEETLTFTMSCQYVPNGESTVTVLSPETAAGVTAILSGDDLSLQYEDICLDAGTFSEEALSPAVCLPRLISALRSGWLLEENEESMDGEDCLRLCMDQTGASGGKIVSAVWLRLSDGTPVRGEIGVDGEIVLTAVFTSFDFLPAEGAAGP